MKENPLAIKCDQIHTRGLEALRSRQIELFKGFGLTLTDRFNISVLFDDPSRKQFSDRVVIPLLRIGKKLGIAWYMANEHFPVHSSVLECRHEKPESIFGHLRDGGVNPRELFGEQIIFSEVLLDRGNILLNALAIPPVHSRIRQGLKDLYIQTGGSPISLDDILHVTVARMTVLGSPEVLDRYIDAFLEIREDVKRSPIALTVNEVYCGPALKLVSPTSVT